MLTTIVNLHMNGLSISWGTSAWQRIIWWPQPNFKIRCSTKSFAFFFFDFSRWSSKSYSKFFGFKNSRYTSMQGWVKLTISDGFFWSFMVVNHIDLWRAKLSRRSWTPSWNFWRTKVHIFIVWVYFFVGWLGIQDFLWFLHVRNLQMWWVGPNTCMSC